MLGSLLGGLLELNEPAPQMEAAALGMDLSSCPPAWACPSDFALVLDKERKYQCKCV